MSSPDDACMVCGTTRENHGDLNHQFSEDGQLIPKKSGPPPRQNPPQERTEAGMRLGNDPVANMSLRLIARLVAKDLLTGQDLLYIFGGPDAPGGRGAASPAPTDNGTQSAEGSSGSDPQ